MMILLLSLLCALSAATVAIAYKATLYLQKILKYNADAIELMTRLTAPMEAEAQATAVEDDFYRAIEQKIKDEAKLEADRELKRYERMQKEAEPVG